MKQRWVRTWQGSPACEVAFSGMAGLACLVSTLYLRRHANDACWSWAKIANKTHCLRILLPPPHPHALSVSSSAYLYKHELNLSLTLALSPLDRFFFLFITLVLSPVIVSLSISISSLALSLLSSSLCMSSAARCSRCRSPLALSRCLRISLSLYIISLDICRSLPLSLSPFNRSHIIAPSRQLSISRSPSPAHSLSLSLSISLSLSRILSLAFFSP